MSKKDNIKYDVDKFVIANYVDAINSIVSSCLFSSLLIASQSAGDFSP